VDEAFEDPRRSEVVAPAVQSAHPREAGGHHLHRGVAVGLVRLVVPRAAVVDAPTGEVVVATTEVRGPQRGDHGEVVGRVVDGPEHHQEVADLGGGEEHGAGLGPVGDTGGLQRGLQGGQRSTGGEEDGDVAEATGALPSVGPLDRPAIDDGGGDGCRYVRSF